MKRYFSGRINGKTYLIGSLLLIPLALMAFFMIIFAYGLGIKGNTSSGSVWFFALLGILFILLMTFEWFSISIRRLHDINFSGWWAIIPIASYSVTLFSTGGASGFKTIVPIIFFVILLIKKGDTGSNEYGLPQATSWWQALRAKIRTPF